MSCSSFNSRSTYWLVWEHLTSSHSLRQNWTKAMHQTLCPLLHSVFPGTSSHPLFPSYLSQPHTVRTMAKKRDRVHSSNPLKLKCFCYFLPLVWNWGEHTTARANKQFRVKQILARGSQHHAPSEHLNKQSKHLVKQSLWLINNLISLPRAY